MHKHACTYLLYPLTNLPSILPNIRFTNWEIDLAQFGPGRINLMSVVLRKCSRGNFLIVQHELFIIRNMTHDAYSFSLVILQIIFPRVGKKEKAVHFYEIYNSFNYCKKILILMTDLKIRYWYYENKTVLISHVPYFVIYTHRYLLSIKIENVYTKSDSNLAASKSVSIEQINSFISIFVIELAETMENFESHFKFVY